MKLVAKSEFSIDNLTDFVEKARLNTYAGGGKFEKEPERVGFHELVYADETWHYRDSFTGYFKSRGMEVVRHKQIPVWAATYGGGMFNNDPDLTRETFQFLKKALGADNKGFVSMRGPEQMKIGKWTYSYTQTGTIKEFEGHETIDFQREEVFKHTIIGGVVVGK